ncbi:hypothetical protein ACMSFX_17240 [Bacteroides thetaiotaomicron]
MDNKKFDLRKDWDSIETVANDIWPEEWSQLNPLEIKALEEIIEKKKSLNTEIVNVPGGMGCDFSVDLNNVYCLLAILWYLKDLTGITNEDIRRKMKSFIETCDKRMQEVYKEVIEPQFDNLISLLKKKH